MSRFTNAAAAGAYWARRRNRLQTHVVDSDQAPAWGTITFSANPSNSQTVTINGTVITFGSTVTIGADLAATLAAVIVYLTANPISGAAVYAEDNGLVVFSTAPADTSVTLAASDATVSAGTLQKQKIRSRLPLDSAPLV